MESKSGGLTRRKPMARGKGFANRGGGFKSTKGGQRQQRHDELLALEDEVGEGVVVAWANARPKKKTKALQQGADGVYVEPFAMNVGEGLMVAPDRVRTIPTLADPSQFRAPQPVDQDTVLALEKTVARRNAAVLEMARGRMCMLHAPYTEFHDGSTTVCAHGNWSDMGKGERRKADDCYTVWACHTCHMWLDQQGATYEEKRQVFLLGMVRQMLAWEQIAVSTTEPPKFRRAAEWALDQLQQDEFDPQHALHQLL